MSLLFARVGHLTAAALIAVHHHLEEAGLAAERVSLDEDLEALPWARLLLGAGLDDHGHVAGAVEAALGPAGAGPDGRQGQPQSQPELAIVAPAQQLDARQVDVGLGAFGQGVGRAGRVAHRQGDGAARQGGQLLEDLGEAGLGPAGARGQGFRAQGDDDAPGRRGVRAYLKVPCGMTGEVVG